MRNNICRMSGFRPGADTHQGAMRYNAGMVKALGTVLRFILNIPNFVMLYVRMMLDREIPLPPRLVLIGAALYVVSPIDLIPGALLPVIGWLEDMLIFYVAMKIFVAMCPPQALERHVATVDYLDRLRKRGGLL
jgi:uncharacterized membrane protein YkvA (DUF1232 family)